MYRKGIPGPQREALIIAMVGPLEKIKPNHAMIEDQDTDISLIIFFMLATQRDIGQHWEENVSDNICVSFYSRAFMVMTTVIDHALRI